MKTAAINKQQKHSFPCPECGKASACLDSRPTASGTRRRRRCECGHRWTTIEVIAEHGGTGGLMVPRDGKRDLERRYDLALSELRHLVELMEMLRPKPAPVIEEADTTICSD